MALVSMKVDQDSGGECSPCSNEYGYGMSLYLSKEQCEALGITEPLKAGQSVMIQARAFVMNATQSVEDDGDDKVPDVNMTLQITDLEVTPSKDSQAQASALYGKDQEK